MQKLLFGVAIGLAACAAIVAALLAGKTQNQFPNEQEFLKRWNKVNKIDMFQLTHDERHFSAPGFSANDTRDMFSEILLGGNEGQDHVWKYYVYADDKHLEAGNYLVNTTLKVLNQDVTDADVRNSLEALRKGLKQEQKESTLKNGGVCSNGSLKGEVTLKNIKIEEWIITLTCDELASQLIAFPAGTKRDASGNYMSAHIDFTFSPVGDVQAGQESATTKLVPSSVQGASGAQEPALRAAAPTTAPPSNPTATSTNTSPSATTDHCEADAPRPQASEETTLLASGQRFLTGRNVRAGANGEFFVVEAALGYDGQCRPDPYQIYVFYHGKQVGTLSPSAMHARSDGAITGFKLLDADHIQFEVDHYNASDPACCASSHESKIVPLSQFASQQAGNSQDNSHTVVPSSQVTSQGIATLEQASARMLWTRVDTGKEVNWVEAKSFCSAQGAEWRLPSTNELGSIFDASGALTTACGNFTCKVSPMFHLSAGGYWTNVEVGSASAMIFVLDGGTTYQGRMDGRGNVRALCVKPLTTSLSVSPSAPATGPVQATPAPQQQTAPKEPQDGIKWDASPRCAGFKTKHYALKAQLDQGNMFAAQDMVHLDVAAELSGCKASGVSASPSAPATSPVQSATPAPQQQTAQKEQTSDGINWDASPRCAGFKTKHYALKAQLDQGNMFAAQDMVHLDVAAELSGCKR